MIKPWGTLFFVLLLQAGLASMAVAAPGNSASSQLSNTTPLQGQWKFSDGYQPAWLSDDFDDLHWQDIDVPNILGQSHGQTELGVYRLSFFVDPAQIDYKQAIYIAGIRNADISYLNGKEIGRTGSLESAWSFDGKNPESLPRVYLIPKNLLRAGNNVLAIKLNTGFGNAWGALYPGGAGIIGTPLLLGPQGELLEKAHQQTVKIVAFDMVFLTLGFLDLLIIGILLKRTMHSIPEFRWLLWGSVLMMMGSTMHDVVYILAPELLMLNLFSFSSMMMLPLINALYFWSQNKNLSLKLIRTVFALWLLFFVTIALPHNQESLKVFAWYGISGLLFAFFTYAVYCAVLGIRYQRVGAIAQCVGLLCYIISIRSQWLPDIFLEHRNIQIGSIIFRYALLFAYFQKIAEMQVSFHALSQKLFSISDATRSEIARELHDGIGQNLSSAKLQLGLSQRDSSHLANVKQELSNAVSGIRRLINGLHISLIDQLGFSAAVRQETQKLTQESGVALQLALDDIALNEKTQQHLYRIIQECCRNAIRHGEAQNISIKLQHIKGIKLIIEDDGCGLDPKTIKPQTTEGGFGMVSLKERVNLLNGSLDIVARQPQGTKIIINLPGN